MNFIGPIDNLNIALYCIKMIFINIGTYYVLGKITNTDIFKAKNWKKIMFIVIITFIEMFVISQGSLALGIVMTILLLTMNFKQTGEQQFECSNTITVLSMAISYIIFFIAVVVNGIPCILLKVSTDNISIIFIVIIYCVLLHLIMNIKRLRNGFIFFNKKIKGQFFEFLIMYFGAIFLILLVIWKNNEILATRQMVFSITIASILMFLTIQKSFQVYYKQKLLIQELNETKKDLKNKTEEVQKLEQENLNFSKKSHSLAHKQKSLEYKLNQLLLTTEISDEKDLKEQIQKVSKELYSKPRIELDKTEITQIDDMLNFMQSECIKNNIDLNLQLSGNIYHIINNIITEDELEILLADHIKDAIIAIKHTDNVNKSILVRLGKIEDCYGLYIYDSGIEFEKETLENLGKKPSTTHKDEGGTGMGFMNTFDTLRKCKGSLIINEIGKPSKENYTKVIMIKFDNKNEFKVVSYKENNN